MGARPVGTWRSDQGWSRSKIERDRPELLSGIRGTGGTYLFMAPEQLRGRPEKPSDLWSLGVVAYVLLTGRQPFSGTTLAELSHEVFFTIPPPPRDVQPSAADESLERILYGLLEKQVTARTASAEDLLSALGGPADSSAAQPAVVPHAGPAQELTYGRRYRYTTSTSTSVSASTCPKMRNWGSR
jgi:serine/threonine protein kinase